MTKLSIRHATIFSRKVTQLGEKKMFLTLPNLLEETAFLHLINEYYAEVDDIPWLTDFGFLTEASPIAEWDDFTNARGKVRLQK